MKRILPRKKFEELMKLAYSNDTSPSLHDDDLGEHAMDEEGVNEMLTNFFGYGNNDEDNDPIVDSNNDRRGN